MKKFKLEKRIISKQQHSRNVQYLWTVSILFVLILLNFAFLTMIASATTEGYMFNTVISSTEWDAQEGLYVDSIVVGESSTLLYIATVSTGDTGTEGDGYVRTHSINKVTGVYSALVDSLEFDTSDCYYPSICYCGAFGIGRYYAICYTDTGSSKQTIVTVNIGTTGTIAAAVTDTQQMTYDGADATGSCQIMKWSGTTYLIAYTVSDYDGWFETYTISDAGAITNAVIDTQEFDTADGRFPRFCAVDSDTVAVVYGGVDTAAGIAFDGWIRTYNVTTGGTITNTATDSWEYETSYGIYPDIMKIGSNYYLSYTGLDNDGYVMSFSITANGMITKLPIFTTEHDTSLANYNRLFYIGLNKNGAYVYGVTYKGTDGDGFVKTFTAGTQLESLEYDTANSLYFSPVLFVNYTYWVISYSGTDNDGFMKTIGIDNEYDLILYDNYINTKGTHEYQIGDTGYTVWANATTNMMLRENLINCSGTHEDYWNSTTGNMMVWANYSGPSLYFAKNSPQETNYTVSKVYQSFLNKYTITYTSSRNDKFDGVLVNATGTTEVGDFVVSKNTLDANGFGDYWGNSTIWSNYTGTTTPIHRFENIINAIGTHEYLLNSTGYWDWANYTSNINQVENIVDATGTHEYNFDTVTGTWNDWANYTGDTTPLTLFENVLYSAGTHEYNIGVGGYNVWANYSTSLSTYENIVDASGTHDSNWDGTGWNVWANYTGDECGNTDLDIITDIVNATGSSDSDYDFDGGWTVWVNYTGDTTPIHHFTNILNATGTHEYLLNNTGYWDWANYTGNSSFSSYLVNIKLNGVLGFINWSGYYNSTSTNISFNVTGNATINGNADVNLSDDVIYIAGFDLDEPFLLLSILFALFYFWWRSESVGMTYIFAMLLIPYIIVVGILYLLPLYITDSNILLFVRILFLLLAVAVGGYTVDIRSKIKKGEKETQNT